MATYVMSDLHGRKKTFDRMLKEIQFQDSDQLYIIGDVIDRGYGGISIYQYCMAQNNIIVLKGNHEYMMLEYFEKAVQDGKLPNLRNNWNSLWFYNGGETTMEEFSKLTDEERFEIYQYIKKEPEYLLITVNAKKYLLVHAGLTGLFRIPEWTLEELMERNIRKEEHVWTREDFLEDQTELPDTTILFGHTPVYYIPHFCFSLTDDQEESCKKNQFYHAAGRIGLDCGCGGGLNLGCLRLEDQKEFYIRCEKGD